MSKFRLLILAVAIPVLVAGCASTQRRAPAEALVGSDYDKAGKEWMKIQACARNGNMGAEDAAFGQNLIDQWLNRHSNYHPPYMQSSMNEYSNIRMSREDCNSLAVEVASARQKSNQRGAAAQQQQQQQYQQQQIQQMQEIQRSLTQPRQTYCNRIGTQVRCNSY